MVPIKATLEARLNRVGIFKRHEDCVAAIESTISLP